MTGMTDSSKSRWLLSLTIKSPTAVAVIINGWPNNAAKTSVITHWRVIDLTTEEHQRLEDYLEYATLNLFGGLVGYSLMEIDYVLNYEATKRLVQETLGIKADETLPFDVQL